MTRSHRPRVRVERQVARPGALLTIDHLQFTLSDTDLVALGEQLLAVLATREKEPHARDTAR